MEQTHYPLALIIASKDAALAMTMGYDEARFEATMITRMLHQLQVILQAMTDQPGQRLGDLPWLSEEERHHLLVEWNATQRDYPQDLCIHQLFEQQVERTPDIVALVCE